MSQNPYEPSPLPAWEGPPPAVTPPEPKVVARRFALAQFAIGVATGFGIWGLTSGREAWDANPYYSIYVLAAGGLASLFRLRGIWWPVLGVYLGQLGGLLLLVPHTGGAIIFPAWLGVLMCGTVQAVVGAVLGGAIGSGLGWLRRKAATRA